MLKLQIQENNELFFDNLSIKVKDLGLIFVKKNRILKKIKKAMIAFVSDDNLILTDSVIYLYRNNIDGMIIRKEQLSDNLKNILLNLGYSIIYLDKKGEIVEIINPFKNVSGQKNRISVITSGTTGIPKVIPHSWETLFTLRKKSDMPKFWWILTYLPGTYAWYQMITMLMFLPRQSIIMSSSNYPEDIWNIGVLHNATAISSTPTFWRYLFLKKDLKDLKKVSLKQITLGGEPIDQAILDRLKNIFPMAKITHIYAATEVGAVVIVNDGKEGFPIDWLNTIDSSRERPQIKIVDGKLWIKSPFSSTNINDWYCTGDIVEIKGDRVIIIGRENSEFVNVGGIKVNVKIVENVLLKHPYILWCRVYAKKSPLVGQVVAADVVVQNEYRDIGSMELEKIIISYLISQGLPDWALPRALNFLHDIPLINNFKTKYE